MGGSCNLLYGLECVPSIEFDLNVEKTGFEPA